MKIPAIIASELEKLQAPYEIKQSARHYKLIVNGKFCGILPFGGGNSSSRRAELNVRSQIRRAAVA